MPDESHSRQNCMRKETAIVIQTRPKIPRPTITPIVSLSSDRLEDGGNGVSILFIMFDVLFVLVRVVVRGIRLCAKLDNVGILSS